MYRIHYDLFTLNYSREIVKDFTAGVNIGMVDIHQSADIISSDKTAFTLDLGVLKKFRINTSDKNLSQSVSLGSSVINVTGSKLKVSTNAEGLKLPVIFRAAASYTMALKGNQIINNSNTFSFLGHIEYESVLNTDRYTTFKVGTEFTIIDILSLRVGYFSRNADLVRSVYSYNLGKFNQVTYGAGVKFPLSKVFEMKTPLSLNVDYVNLESPSRERPALSVGNIPDYGRYNTFAISLHWVPGM